MSKIKNVCAETTGKSSTLGFAQTSCLPSVIVLTASVNSSGSSIAGEPLTLMCSVTRALNVTGNVTLQWLGSDGSPVMSDNAVRVGAPSLSEGTTSLPLHFSPLLVSHGGEYSCRADFTSEDAMYTISALRDVIVGGKNNFTYRGGEDNCMEIAWNLYTHGNP